MKTKRNIRLIVLKNSITFFADNILYLRTITKYIESICGFESDFILVYFLVLIELTRKTENQK